MMSKNKYEFEVRTEKLKMKGSEKMMKTNKLNKYLIVIGILLVSSVMVFAGPGGIIPLGTGTSAVYGVTDFQDNKILNADASGATNIPSAGIVSLNANKLEAGTVATAIDGSAVTNLGAANIAAAGTLPQLNAAALTALDAANITAGTTVSAVDGGAATNLTAGNITAGGTFLQQNGSALTALDAANITAGTTASAFDGAAITNIASAGITSLDASKLIAGSTASAIDGVNITNVTAAAPGDMLSTNATEQSKAGKLNLNGGLTVGLKTIFTPSAIQTIATNAAVAANAAFVVVKGDGIVTATIADGTAAGQLLTIRGNDAVNTVQLTNSAVVPTFTLGTNDVISLVWDGVWIEQYRRDN